MTFIFNPKDYSTGELWALVLQREELEDAGIIGDCLLRKLAEQEADGGPVIMRMEIIGYRSALEILRRKYPDTFEN
jgi:predicted NUDIX family NTP pyrophosphohydrolase